MGMRTQVVTEAAIIAVLRRGFINAGPSKIGSLKD
jgi:hypothetical protein